MVASMNSIQRHSLEMVTKRFGRWCPRKKFQKFMLPLAVPLAWTKAAAGRPLEHPANPGRTRRNQECPHLTGNWECPLFLAGVPGVAQQLVQHGRRERAARQRKPQHQLIRALEAPVEIAHRQSQRAALVLEPFPHEQLDQR